MRIVITENCMFISHMEYVDNLHTDWYYYKKPKSLVHFLQKSFFIIKISRWIWVFCSNIDLCGGHLHFLGGMNMQLSLITSFYVVRKRRTHTESGKDTLREENKENLHILIMAKF